MKSTFITICLLLALLICSIVAANPIVISSGSAAISTGGTDAAVTLLNAYPGQFNHLVVINNGTVAGQFSFDNFASDASTLPLPAGPSSVQIDTPFQLTAPIKLRRIPSSGADTTNVQAMVY